MLHLLMSLFIVFGLTPAQAEADWKKFNLQNGCQIFDAEGESLKMLPGEFCQFYENGDFLTATNSTLKLIDKFNAVKWELPGNYHHQINKSADGKRILALDHHQVKVDKKTVRAEIFKVISMEGKVLLQADSRDLLNQVKTNPYSKEELTHINSFYEIPKLTTKRLLPDYLKEGNYILNSYRLGIFFLSSDLKKVVHHFLIPPPSAHLVHDAQILENGTMLLFNNMASEASYENPYSAIEQFDLVENKRVFQFTAQPGQMFFSLFCGGVQQLDDEHILFSHLLTGTYIYSKKSNSIVASTYKTHFRERRFFPSQQVKALDLRKFLSHWK